LIHHKANVGFPKTLNEALRLAEGKYVSIISTDDIWMPEFIENHVKVFEECGEAYGLVYGRSYTMDEQGNRHPEMLPGRAQNPEGNVKGTLLNKNFIPAETADSGSTQPVNGLLCCPPGRPPSPSGHRLGWISARRDLAGISPVRRWLLELASNFLFIR
jgi:GT2 family glycosyltransferase